MDESSRGEIDRGVETVLKRVLALAQKVTGDDYRALDLERTEDGWRLTLAGLSKHGGTLHTTLFGLEQLLREKLKARKKVLQEQLATLSDDDEL